MSASDGPDDWPLPEALRTNGVDIGVSGAKAILGLVPAGGFFAEILGAVIPAQRADRFARFLAKLERELERLGQRVEILDAHRLSVEQTVLFEAGGAAAARAFTEGRLDRIARVVAVGLLASDLEASRARRLLDLLGELDDEDVIELCHREEPYKSDEDWLERHADVIWSYQAWKKKRDAGASPDEIRRLGADSELRIGKLTSLGLLEQQPNLDLEDLAKKMDAFKPDEETGLRNYRPEGSEHTLSYFNVELSDLGRTVLEELGLWTRPPPKPPATPAT